MGNNSSWGHKMDPEFEKRLQREIKNQHYKAHKNHKKYFLGIRIDDKQRCPKTNKVCYSKADANSLINHPRRSKKVPMRTYVCEFCGSYHITSKKLSSYK